MLKEQITQYLKEHTGRSPHRYIKCRDPDLWSLILNATSFLPENAYPQQRCWHILNSIFHVPLCPIDQIPLKWFDNRYLKYSSQSAKARCPQFNKKRTEVARSRRGVVISEREQYRKDVWSHTKKNWRIHKHKIPFSCRRGREWHLDHKLSIEYGYTNKVDAAIIGHWCNFEILKASENYTKHSKSSITLEQLMLAINQL